MAWLARLTAMMIAAAACGGSLPGSSGVGGGSTIEWQKVAAYEETCLVPGNSILDLNENSTNAEWSEALGEDIEEWESQEVPDALDAYQKATTDYLKEIRKVMDSQPPDGRVFETLDDEEFNDEFGESLDDDAEAVGDAWAKIAPLVRYRLAGSRCFQDADSNVDLTPAADYVTSCGSYACDFSVWYVERDAQKLTFEIAFSNLDEDTLLPLPDCSENLIVRDGSGMYYGASSCEFKGNIRDGKVPYQGSSEEADVGIAVEYELPESASDLELLAAFELEEEDGGAEGFIISLSDIER